MFDFPEMDTNTIMMIALAVAVLIAGIVAAMYYTDSLQKVSGLLNLGALSSLWKTEA
jgi:hypothetical protein